jgi:hypothetical protein
MNIMARPPSPAVIHARYRVDIHIPNRAIAFPQS